MKFVYVINRESRAEYLSQRHEACRYKAVYRRYSRVRIGWSGVHRSDLRERAEPTVLQSYAAVGVRELRCSEGRRDKARHAATGTVYPGRKIRYIKRLERFGLDARHHPTFEEDKTSIQSWNLALLQVSISPS